VADRVPTPTPIIPMMGANYFNWTYRGPSSLLTVEFKVFSINDNGRILDEDA